MAGVQSHMAGFNHNHIWLGFMESQSHMAGVHEITITYGWGSITITYGWDQSYVNSMHGWGSINEFFWLLH